MSLHPTLRSAAAAGFRPRLLWDSMLAHPWCRPEGGATKPGDALLVGVTGEVGSLFRLGGPRDRTRLSLSDAVTTDAWQRAERLAQRHAGTALACGLLGSTKPPAAVFVAASGVASFTNVSGESYGGAFLLAHTSRWLDVAPPVDLVACAKIDDSGTLGFVDGLETKLQTIWDYALAVKRVVVSAEQKVAAETIAAGRLEVFAFDHVEELVPYVFESLVHQRDAHLRANPEFAATRARALEAWVANRNPQLRAWEAVAQGAEFLSTLLADRPEATSARIVGRIARRHTGAGAALLDWPEDDELPARTELRHRYLAQVVQSSADSGEPEVARRDAAKARALIPSRESRNSAHLVLAGAVGRALAATGPDMHEQALSWMLDVVDDWFAIGERSESSYAVCEALRLASLSGDAPALARLGPALDFWRDAPELDERLEVPSLWVDLERVRSELLLGRPQPALDAVRILRKQMSQANQHLPFAIVRLEAIALDRLGKQEEAEKVRAAMAEDPHQATVEWVFELDRHVRDGVEALPTDPPATNEVTRCLKLFGELGARRVQREYRY
ncbi:MAG: hypothetical protein H6716_20750 [Polyangiaceae bacterium]|nr:hypothetical protein [Polyangiaceae bacterium]